MTNKTTFINRLNSICNTIGNTGGDTYFWNNGLSNVDIPNQTNKIDNGTLTLSDLGISGSPENESNYFNGRMCHGFALYISSLCSGENVNILTTDDSKPSGSWMVFRSYKNNSFTEQANDLGGLQVGDFVRFNSHSNDPKEGQHSAIVRQLGDNVIFLQTYDTNAEVVTNQPFNGGKIIQYGKSVDVYTEAQILENADFIARYVPGKEIVTITLVDEVHGTKIDQRIKGGKIGILPTLSSENHIFEGWYINGVEYDPKQEVNDDITITAEWKHNQCVLQFDWARGFEGSSNKKTIEYDYGTSVTLNEIDGITKTLNFDDRDRAEFKYWATYKGGEYVELTGSLTMTEDITLYAIFRDYINTISFNCNGGTDLPSDHTSKERMYIIKPNVPTRVGYKFIGWKAEKYNDLFLPGDGLDLISYKDGEEICLTAQWEELYYVMTFDAFGVSEVLPIEIPFSQIPLNQNGVKALRLTEDMFPMVNLPSYGWRIKRDMSGNIYRVGDELPEIKSYDFELADAYPRNKNEYTVTFDANGGENAPKPQIARGGTLTLTGKEPVRAYHHFLGWSTNSDDINAEYTLGSSISVSGNITLYAVWVGGCPRVKYETGVSDIDPYPVGNMPVYQLYTPECLSTGMVVSNTIPERTGYIFDGWSSDVTVYSVYDDEQKKSSYPGETLMISGINEDNYYSHMSDTVTLTAKWIPDANYEHEFPVREDYWHRHKITFDANGGDSAPEPQYVNMGICNILTSEEPTRYYHHFMGWTTDPDGYEVEYSPASLIMTDHDMTLYAVWAGGCPRIKFESGVPTDCATPAYDIPEAMLYTIDNVSSGIMMPERNPSRIGYVFDGWDCDKSHTFNADGSVYFSDLSSDNLLEHVFDTITLTAKWRPVNEDKFCDVKFYDGYNIGYHNYIKVRKGDKYCNDYSNGYHVEHRALPTLHDFTDNLHYFAWGAPDGGILTEDSTVSVSGDHDIYAIFFDGMPFSDMDGYRWADKAVAICKYLGYISGTSETTYSPGVPATRYQAAAVLSRADGSAPTENNPFYDIKTDSAENSAATWAWKNGISAGSNGAFEPNREITREELTAFLYRFALYRGIADDDVYDIDMPVDMGSVSDGLRDQMIWALANGIITVNEENKLRPNDAVTRAELAVFMLRIFILTGIIPYCF